MSTHKSLLKYVLNDRFLGRDREEFSLSEVYDEAEGFLQRAAPNNNNIRATIRKNLQALRGDGVIIFVEGRQGEYKLRPCLDRTWSSEAIIDETDCDPVTKELIGHHVKKVHFGEHVDTRVYVVDHDKAMKRHGRRNKPKTVVAPGMGFW
jgi:hypothetical protein